MICILHLSPLFGTCVKGNQVNISFLFWLPNFVFNLLSYFFPHHFLQLNKKAKKCPSCSINCQGGLQYTRRKKKRKVWRKSPLRIDRLKWVWGICVLFQGGQRLHMNLKLIINWILIDFVFNKKLHLLQNYSNHPIFLNAWYDISCFKFLIIYQENQNFANFWINKIPGAIRNWNV